MTHSFPARRSSDLDASGATRPVREWLADQARVPAQLPGTTKGFPGVSRTDPAAAWSARTVRGRFGYALNVLIDTTSGAALDVEETPARFAGEVDAGHDMQARAAARFDYRHRRVAADTAYGSATFLDFDRAPGALPPIPVMV